MKYCRRFLGYWIVLIAAIFIVTGCNQKDSIAVYESKAAAALLKEFETVFFSRTQLLFNSESVKHLSELETSELRFPFGYLWRAFEALKNQSSVAVLANSAAVLVGARNFTPPNGIGDVRSQRCYIVILRNRSTFDLGEYSQTAPEASVAGMPAWKWSAMLGEFGENNQQPSTLYATKIGKSCVVVANGLKHLQTIAEQMVSKENETKILDGFREWVSISRYEYWGYRRYQHREVFSEMASGMDTVTPGAEALMFFLNSESRTAAVRLLASNGSTANKKNAQIKSADAEMPILQPTGKGVWETTAAFTGNEKSWLRLVYIMSWFGFTTYP